MTELHWTDTELARMTEMWNAFATQDQIAAEMGKSRGAVAHRLTHLGLRSRKRRPDEPEAQGRVWTDDEHNDLRRLWNQQKTPAQIAELMERRVTAIVSRAHQLGLTGTKKLTMALPRVDVAPVLRRELPLVPPAKTCQWLEGEPAERDFCGKKSEPGISYCLEHGVVCYVPSVPRIFKEASF